jgi:hypothetical protein
MAKKQFDGEVGLGVRVYSCVGWGEAMLGGQGGPQSLRSTEATWITSLETEVKFGRMFSRTGFNRVLGQVSLKCRALRVDLGPCVLCYQHAPSQWDITLTVQERDSRVRAQQSDTGFPTDATPRCITSARPGAS